MLSLRAETKASIKSLFDPRKVGSPQHPPEAPPPRWIFEEVARLPRDICYMNVDVTAALRPREVPLAYGAYVHT